LQSDFCRETQKWRKNECVKYFFPSSIMKKWHQSILLRCVLLLHWHRFWGQGDQMSFWKVVQNEAQTIFCQNKYITNTLGKSSKKFWITSVIFKTTLSKQPPNRRAFAQSGHTVWGILFVLFFRWYEFTRVHMYLEARRGLKFDLNANANTEGFDLNGTDLNGRKLTDGWHWQLIIRVTRWICENITRRVAQPFFCQN
jgi:hypothetical protein